MDYQKLVKKMAILVLSCKDYEALELSLAAHMKFAPSGVVFYILQNCRGDYDSERTLGVAERYEYLYPGRVKVVDTISPRPAYLAIKELLKSADFKNYDYICKVDDDAFPLTSGWLEKLSKEYFRLNELYGQQVAYTAPLINNNTWGFARVVEVMDLFEEYKNEVAVVHYSGSGSKISPRIINSADKIEKGSHGTIWGYSHIAKWLHTKTTYNPEKFVEKTADLLEVEVDNKERFSIGCIFFEKTLWFEMDDGGVDDEHALHMYCASKNKKIFAIQSIPFVHLAYYSQREAMRELVEELRPIYQRFLGLKHPIALRQDRALEVEARLRWIEARSSDCMCTRKKSIKGVLKRKIKSFIKNYLVKS